MIDKKNSDVTINFDEAVGLVKAETIRRILPGAFHEMNNHVTAIMGYTELLLGEMSGPKSVISDLQNIQEGGAQLQELIGILSRLSSSSGEKDRGGFPLVRTIEDTIRLLRKIVSNKKIKIHFKPGFQDNIPAVGNENNFKMALSTLLVEMIETLPRGTEIGMAISLNSDKEVVVNVNITETTDVSDIPSRVETFQNGIFAREIRDNVCRSIIEAMGGKLLFALDEDKMAGFGITLLRSSNGEQKSYLDNHRSFEPDVERYEDKGCC